MIFSLLLSSFTQFSELVLVRCSWSVARKRKADY
jgi:hypothetical protein